MMKISVSRLSRVKQPETPSSVFIQHFFAKSRRFGLRASEVSHFWERMGFDNTPSSALATFIAN